MTEEKKQPEEKKPIPESDEVGKKGYQPNQGELDPENPPDSGSGVPQKDSSDTDDNDKQDKD